jgi:flagellar motor switch protein FliG
MGEGRIVMDFEEITGRKKAAILLLTMDEEMSKEILKELEEDEIEALGREIAKLKLIPESVVNKVHDEFLKRLQTRNNLIADGQDRFRMLIKKSFGDDKAEQFIGNMETRKGMPGEFLRRCDPKMLATVLRGEHPQTIALVFSMLGSKRAGEAIAALPDRTQGDVVMRMAYLEKVDMDVIDEIEEVIRQQLEGTGSAEGKRLGGVEIVAGILNQMDRTLENELLLRLEEQNPDLADKIKQHMFTFDDLLRVDDKNIQVLLKEISSDDITLALKGASDAMKEKIFGNMSERAAAMLREDLEAMGPVRISDVEKSQVKIAMTAKRLDEEGKIALSRGGEKFV